MKLPRFLTGNQARTTGWLLVAVVALLAGWDVFVATNGVPGDTISEIVLGLCHRQPALAFALGFVAGHLVWKNPGGPADGA